MGIGSLGAVEAQTPENIATLVLDNERDRGGQVNS